LARSWEGHPEVLPLTSPITHGSTPRVALVHDFLVDLRGAERVFLAICEMWPDADVFTAIYDEVGTEGAFADRRIHTSFVQRLRPTARTFRAFLPLYPAAIESFDFSDYDLVVSSSSAWAHAIICDESTAHVCYCHNPFRYAWNGRDQALAHRDPISRALLRVQFRRWRQWDWIAAQRVDRYVANSRATQARIAAYFGRQATVVHPPVETRRFSPGQVSDYYAVVAELMPHKRIDVAIEAFNRLRRPLVVIGDGPAARALRRIAGPTVRFTGRVSDSTVEAILRSARALVVPAAEEFGIAAVEAQASGRPVIAPRAGGTLETVVEGVTGALWSGGPAELAETVRGFDDAAVDPVECVENAARFDRRIFERRLRAEVQDVLDEGGLRRIGERPPLRTTRFIQRAIRDAVTVLPANASRHGK
jgi:glycosyltransferase involved in cell wall biosynthesis